MISLSKTKSSDFCRKFFSENSDKGLNVVHNNYDYLNRFLTESYDDELAKEAGIEFSKFKNKLKEMNLKILHLAFGYSQQHDHYTFSYIIRSKNYDNQDYRVDGMVLEQIPFVFFPSMFAKFLLDILSQVPYDDLKEVSNGN
ncbi:MULTISPECIES: hypothetical protein [Burkholderiaceae]|uniref:hypothetical protein n=1 Tax=Burkholderiaceae TaxID=119060 RepID=UPI000F5488B1|nr:MULTISPECIES: hypothetical protein [Burkholderiaceae]VVE12000.1 hypothetical protein PSP20601_02687 [Pandoraea sputorum]